MRIRTFACLGVVGLVLLLCGPSALHAASDPAAACKQRKSKAAGKDTTDVLKAIVKDLNKQDDVKLSQSLAKADSKLTKAFVKAEAKGGCQTTGDAASISLLVDILAEQAHCAMTPNCEGRSGGAGGGDSRTTDTEGCVPPCDGLNCMTPCDGATPGDVIETTVTSPNAGPTSIAEFEFPTINDIHVDIEAPQADSALNPLQVLFILDGSLFSTLDNIRMQLVRIFRNGTTVPKCDGPAGVASPDPCVSQRQIVGDDLHITVLTTNASRWKFDQLPFGPVGAEFQVNTYTTAAQYAPSVASDAAGNFVVAWESFGQDGGGDGIFGQRYNSLGTPLGTEFQVNTYTTNAQFSAAVASDTNGNFVVVWNSQGQDGSSFSIFGRRYDSSGTPLGGEFQVNTYTTSAQYNPAVARDINGNFVVVWDSDGQDGDNIGIFGQRYDSSGTPLGAEFQVNTYTTQRQDEPAVATDTNGNFVVVWQSYGQDGDRKGIFGRRYDSSGTPLGTEFQVNTYTTSSQERAAIESDTSGGFVVVWQGGYQDGSSDGIFAQRYDSSGTPLGTEFQVNTYTTNYQGFPAVATDPNGNFVVAWSSYGPDGYGQGIFGQRYDSSGTTVRAEFQVNAYTTYEQFRPAIASDSTGNFVVVWDSYDDQDGSSDGIFGQRFVTK